MLDLLFHGSHIRSGLFAGAFALGILHVEAGVAYARAAGTVDLQI